MNVSYINNIHDFFFCEKNKNDVWKTYMLYLMQLTLLLEKLHRVYRTKFIKNIIMQKSWFFSNKSHFLYNWLNNNKKIKPDVFPMVLLWILYKHYGYGNTVLVFNYKLPYFRQVITIALLFFFQALQNL